MSNGLRQEKGKNSMEDLVDIRLLLFINILISALAPLAVKVWNKDLFTPAEEVFFALASFVVLTVFEISLIIRGIVNKVRSVHKLWEAHDKIDFSMYELRRMFHRVCENSYGPSDLFVSFFSRKIDQLDSLLVDATTKQEIRIDETMFQVTSELLYSSFIGRDEDIFRAIHYCSENEFFFGLHSRRYFRQAFELIQSRRLKEVRRLIVYASDAEVQDLRTQMLIAFHQANAHYDCRLISKDNFDRILDDFGLLYLTSDFGIYGDRYLYKSYVNHLDKIVGSYSKNSNEIRRFTECFEACWISPSARMIVIPKAQKGATIDELLGDDATVIQVSTNVRPLIGAPPPRVAEKEGAQSTTAVERAVSASPEDIATKKTASEHQ